MNDSSPTSMKEFVLRRITDPLSLGGHEFSGTAWFLVLGVILTIGVAYVVWMYVRDGHSIGWFWGTFLALLRLAVYAIIAFVFLLPAFQNWEETKQQSKVVVAVDVSKSMGKQDDPVVPGVDAKLRPTRIDKIIDSFGDPSSADGFFARMQKTNPVTMYRLGSFLDEDYVEVHGNKVWDRKSWEEAKTTGTPTEGQPLTRELLAEFLKPDLTSDFPDTLTDEQLKAARDRRERLRQMVKSTNVGESVLGVLSKEINNMPQGIVVFTDGRSTEGGSQAFKDLGERARRAKVPVFVVVVGENRDETKIEITDARAPDKARPEDPFPVSVDVTGMGIAPGREVTIYLDVFRPGQDPKKDQPFKTIEKRVPWKGAQLPRAQVEFPITPAEYGEVGVNVETPMPMGGKPGDKPDKPGTKPAPTKPEEVSNKPEFKVGEWHFVPRVPRDQAELNNEPFHTREPVAVRIEKKPLRVLVMASAPMRDYQFIRTMLVREADKHRLELAIYLQPLPGQARRMGIVQDISPDRMLTHFPDRLDDKKLNEDALYNLANYDVIVAFDPDWTEKDSAGRMSITKEQTAMLDRWVSQQGGGLVIVAGPIHTLELYRAAALLKPAGGDREKIKRLLEDNPELATLKPILDLYPVVLQDLRLQKERNTAIPAGLNFVNATPEMEFLKLNEEEEKSSTSTTKLIEAWNEFFRGPNAKADSRLLRGFYGYYPVEKAKDTAITVATFKDDTSTDKKEPPYLVIMPNYGAGRLVWLGSGETWRLRQYREVWHERFWTKLVRYAAAGSTGKTTRRIVPSVGSRFTAGNFIEVEAQFFGKDLLPLPQNVNPKPKVVLRPPVGVSDVKTEYEMSPKSTGGGEWDGRFTTRFLLRTPGEYGVDIGFGQADEPSVSQKIKVIETDAEMENTRPDLAAAFELASDAEPVLERIDDPAKKAELRRALQRARAGDGSGDKPAAADKEKLHLVFDLRGASLIPDTMKTVVNKQESRGKVEDLWDFGLPLVVVLWYFALTMIGLAVVLGLMALLFYAIGRPVLGSLIGAGLLLTLGVAAFIGRILILNRDAATPFSIVLGIVVVLLSIEWLTRKLLRLA